MRASKAQAGETSPGRTMARDHGRVRARYRGILFHFHSSRLADAASEVSSTDHL